MNRNVMIVLAGGFLIAVLVALLVQASLSGGEPEEPVVVREEPKVQIVVAKKDMAVGTELSDENMSWQDWPEGAVFPGAVQREDDKKPSEIIEGRLRRAVVEGEPITEAVLVQSDGNLMAASLGEGMRAFSISVDASSMVSGFVGPGDYVDIIMTHRSTVEYQDDQGETSPVVENLIDQNIDDLASETILQNMKVLAVDQSAIRDEDSNAVVGRNVTLEVTYKQAEILALASRMGDLSLALRRLGDESLIPPTEAVTTDARLTKIDDEVITQILLSADSPSHGPQFVRIYRGNQVEDLQVGQ